MPLGRVSVAATLAQLSGASPDKSPGAPMMDAGRRFSSRHSTQAGLMSSEIYAPLMARILACMSASTMGLPSSSVARSISAWGDFSFTARCRRASQLWK